MPPRQPSRDRFRLLLILLSALLSAAVASAQPSQVGGVIGEVRVNRQGFPPKQILVNLQARGATINSAYCDSQGRFSFGSLPGGVYEINIQDDDYLPVTQEAVLNLAISTTVRVSITLEQRPASKEQSSEKRVAGSNANAVDINALSSQFPKKAVQEYEKGLKATGSGDSESAAGHFLKCLSLAPGFYPAHNEVGRIYLAKSDFSAAQHEFENVIRLNQSDAQAHFNLGNVFLLTNRLDEALVQVQEGLRREPESAIGHFFLGSIYQKMHKPDESEQALQEALRLDPKMNKVHLALVNVYLSQNKRPQAASELKSFIQQAPDDPLSPRCREALRKLENTSP